MPKIVVKKTIHVLILAVIACGIQVAGCNRCASATSIVVRRASQTTIIGTITTPEKLNGILACLAKGKRELVKFPGEYLLEVRSAQGSYTVLIAGEYAQTDAGTIHVPCDLSKLVNRALALDQ